MRLILAGLIILSFWGCKKDDPNNTACSNSPLQVLSSQVPCQSSSSYSNGVYILNEGTFTFGNASVSYYDPSTKTVSHQVFSGVNSRGLGDVLQSGYVSGDQIYWVVNNSQKIEVTGLNNLCSHKTIAGFGAPRYSYLDPNGNLWVTELYQEGIWVVDTAEACVIRRINTGGWTEQIERRGSELYILIKPSLNDSSTQPGLLVYDWNSLSGVERYDLSSTPIDFMLSQDGFLVVGSTGNNLGTFTQAQTSSGINTSTRVLPSSMGTPVAIEPDFQQGAFIAANGLFQFSNDTIVQVYPGGRNFYGMSVDYSRQEIYLFDAKDYVSRGTALRLNANYQLIDSFETGIIPSSAIFIP